MYAARLATTHLQAPLEDVLISTVWGEGNHSLLWSIYIYPVAAFDVNDSFDYSAALARALNQDIDVLFYYGKDDLACNYVGGFDTAFTLEWDGKQDFQARGRSSVCVGPYIICRMLRWRLLELLMERLLPARSSNTDPSLGCKSRVQGTWFPLTNLMQQLQLSASLLTR